jgi:LCP family protein required for cell wall assembly
VAVKVVAGLLSAAVLVASGWLWTLVHEFNTSVNRVDAISGGPDVDGQDQNILLVGNDSRGGLTDAQLKAIGTQAEPGFNTDTILLVHLPANGSKATVVSFSRDLNVYIPVLGREGKINSAFANGACPDNRCRPTLTAAQERVGARALVDTVTQFSGLHIDHYVEVGLLGFFNITDELGGVPICLKHAVQDRYSAIDLPAGHQMIKGQQALAFVRQRHGLPHGAFSRIQRQQYFLGAVFRKLTSAGVLVDPLKQQRVVMAVAASLSMDPQLNPLDLAHQMQNLTAGNLQFVTVPVKGQSTNSAGQSVDLPNTAALPAFWARVLGRAQQQPVSSSVPRGQVTVGVLNGTSQVGLATQTSRQLTQLGFGDSITGNAARTSQTLIEYPSGQEAAARTLAAVVPHAQLIARSSGSGVTLILGSDFTGLSSAGSGSRSADPGSGSGSAGDSSSASGSPLVPAPRTAAQDDCID